MCASAQSFLYGIAPLSALVMYLGLLVKSGREKEKVKAGEEEDEKRVDDRRTREAAERIMARLGRNEAGRTDDRRLSGAVIPTDQN